MYETLKLSNASTNVVKSQMFAQMQQQLLKYTKRRTAENNNYQIIIIIVAFNWWLICSDKIWISQKKNNIGGI